MPRQAQQFRRLEIWLVVQVGVFMGDTAFLFRMEGSPPTTLPFKFNPWI